MENFWRVIESVFTKKKEDRDPGSNPNLSYPNLSALLLHHHTDLPKVRKNYVHKLANYLSYWTDTSIAGDPSPFHNF